MTDETEPRTEEWTCPNCGSTDPHNSLTFPIGASEGEIEVDVTCQSVYITPVGDGDGFAFDHDEFEEILSHYEEVR